MQAGKNCDEWEEPTNPERTCDYFESQGWNCDGCACSPSASPSRSPSQSPIASPSESPSASPSWLPSALPSRLPTRHPTPAGDTLVKVGGSLTLASFTAAMKDDADMESAIKTAIAGAVAGASAADVTITCFDTAAVCNGRRRRRRLAADRRRLQENYVVVYEVAVSKSRYEAETGVTAGSVTVADMQADIVSELNAAATATTGSGSLIYHIKVNAPNAGLSAVTVSGNAAAPTAAPVVAPTAPPTEEEGSDVGMIIGIVIGVLALGGGVAFFVMKKKQ